MGQIQVATGWARTLGGPLVVVLLYALGLAHWGIFYHWGDMSFRQAGWEGSNEYDTDWVKEHDYYTVLRKALERREIPYFMDRDYQGTSHFLGMPETNLAPDILLLPYLTMGELMFVHTVLLYSLGFLGCLLIRKRYRLDTVPFALLWLLFNFNGFITSHLSVGHSMWNGYFLLPFVALYLLEMLEEPGFWGAPLKMALVLAGMMLVGSFHIVIWCWMLLLLLVAFNWRLWKPGLVALVFSGWLSFFRILPAAYTFWGAEGRRFWAGYPSLESVLDALIVLHGPHYPTPTGGWTYSFVVDHWLRWWEYDVYLGLAGLAALVYFGIYRRLRGGPELARYRYAELDAPLLTLAFLSLNYFYLFVADLPLPLFNAEGVSSRFLMIPLVVLMVLAAIHMQRVLERGPWSAALKVLLIGGLLQTAFALGEHSFVWRVHFLKDGGEVPGLGQIEIAALPPEWQYVACIFGSAVVSLLGVVVWLMLLVWSRRPTAPTAQPVAVG